MPQIRSDNQPITQITIVDTEPHEQAKALALMADRATRGKFVCYHNDALAAVAKDYRAAVRAAVAKNIPEDASLIFRIAPGEDDAVRAIIEEAEIS